MAEIDEDGMLIDSRVTLRRFPHIEHGPLEDIHAIVVHQTDTQTEEQVFGAYRSSQNGAHFLIDRDGRIFQTASLSKRCYHIGRLIKSKCLSISKDTCANPDTGKILALSWTKQIKAIDALERDKDYPDRFPVNADSIGIEIVGKSLSTKTYEAVTLP